MKFSEWLKTKQDVHRRVDRGFDFVGDTIAALFNKWFWKEVVYFIAFLAASIIWVPMYCIGTFGEWRENRRDGIRTVRK